jgi:hypothetical protein
VQPGLVGTILSNPFTGASDPRPFRAYKALSIDMGIGEEESVSTRGNFVLEGFYRNAAR